GPNSRKPEREQADEIDRSRVAAHGDPVTEARAGDARRRPLLPHGRRPRRPRPRAGLGRRARRRAALAGDLRRLRLDRRLARLLLLPGAARGVPGGEAAPQRPVAGVLGAQHDRDDRGPLLRRLADARPVECPRARRPGLALLSRDDGRDVGPERPAAARRRRRAAPRERVRALQRPGAGRLRRRRRVVAGRRLGADLRAARAAGAGRAVPARERLGDVRGADRRLVARSAERVSSGAGRADRRMTAAGGVAAAPEEAHGERHGWLLAVCCVAQFMVILDLSIVNVALPAIQSSLGFSSIDLQWVVDAYAIAFAGFLMVGGRATDRYGQRRALVLALAGFAAASLVGGLAPTQNVLIAARGFQGLCGALMAAASLAAITSAFPPGPARHRAIGLWAAMNGAGGATGVLLGGVITDTVGWRWVLLINVPVGLAAAAGAAVLLSDDAARGKAAGRIDVAGALTLTGGLVALVYGIVAAGYLGWGAAGAWGPIAAGVALLAAFLALETRTAAPLVPLRALTPQLRRANGVVLLFSAALFPMWFVSSLYLQQVLALSPLEAGLAFLPMALTIMVAARQAGRLVSLFGARSVLTSGLTMMTAGLLLLA